jgi:pimeloyl-ACP methyl ester carboxylesterase
MDNRPLDLWVWGTRQALARAGLQRVEIGTLVGPQVAFVGGSGPALMLLHGAGDQAGTWFQVVAKLLQGHTLIIPDLAGHGDSAPAAGPIEASAIFAGLEGVLAHRAAGARVTVVGNSLGAWMAMLLASRHPEWIERVVAVDGGSLQTTGVGANLLPRSREDARALLALTRDPSTAPLPDAVVDDMVRVARDGSIARFIATEAGMAPWIMTEAQLRELKVPVRLIWGASDRLVPLEYAYRIQAALPDAELSVIEACGHVPQQEAPERFLAALLKLLPA